MSIVHSTFRGLLGLVGYALRTFFLTAISVAVGLGGILAILSYWIAGDDSVIMGAIAAVVALLVSAGYAIFVAVQLTISMTIRKAIKQAAIGSLVFNGIFDIMLGINDDNPSGGSGFTKSIHGVTREELEKRMTAAGEEFLRLERIESALPRLVRWLMKKMQSMLVWSVVKVVMLQTALISQGPEIDLLNVRENLAGIIDDKLGDFIRGNARRTISGVGAGAIIAVLLFAGLLHYLPTSF